MPKIVKEVAYIPKLQSKKKVAAYCRVSSGKDAMLHSLSAQVSYYNNLIQRENEWIFVGVYSDEAVTGTKEERAGFQQMCIDCKAGKIDMVITKSISRFARNTVTLLETVRELKLLGIDVYFEEQRIHSISSDGELMLTILASFAQEESLSASENQKWRVKNNFQNGIPCNSTMLGYRYDNGKLIIKPTEAEIVKFIFKNYLDGKGYVAIMKMLNEKGVKTRFGNEWHKNSIMYVLRNYAYTGNLILQTTYQENHLTKKTLVNNGELPKYHVSNSHEAIISLEDFNAVQEEMKQRAKKHNCIGREKQTYPFTSKIVCGICGKNYRRKVTKSGVKWICPTYNTLGKKECPSKAIPEATLSNLVDEIGGIDKITAITTDRNNTLVFSLTNGETAIKQWQDRSRAESWTPEMRKAAGQKTKDRMKEENLCNAQ